MKLIGKLTDSHIKFLFVFSYFLVIISAAFGIRNYLINPELSDPPVLIILALCHVAILFLIIIWTIAGPDRHEKAEDSKEWYAKSGGMYIRF